MSDGRTTKRFSTYTYTVHVVLNLALNSAPDIYCPYNHESLHNFPTACVTASCLCSVKIFSKFVCTFYTYLGEIHNLVRFTFYNSDLHTAMDFIGGRYCIAHKKTLPFQQKKKNISNLVFLLLTNQKLSIRIS